MQSVADQQINADLYQEIDFQAVEVDDFYDQESYYNLEFVS